MNLTETADSLCPFHRTCLLDALVDQLDHSDTTPETVIELRQKVGRWADRCAAGNGHTEQAQA